MSLTRLIIYVLFLIFALNALSPMAEANESIVQKNTPELQIKSLTKNTGNIFVYGGISNQKEEGQFKKEENRQSNIFGIGYRRQFLNQSLWWVGQIERSNWNDQSGNETLNVAESYESYRAWFEVSKSINSYFAGFLGFGVGAYQRKAKINLFNEIDDEVSSWKEMLGLNFGIRTELSVVFVQFEARLNWAREVIRSPYPEGVLLGGLQF